MYEWQQWQRTVLLTVIKFACCECFAAWLKQSPSVCCSLIDRKDIGLLSGMHGVEIPVRTIMLCSFEKWPVWDLSTGVPLVT